MMPLYFYKFSCTLFLLIIITSQLDFAKSDTQIIKILPTNGSLLTPIKPRLSIPSSFAKNYWVPATYFNSGNFQEAFPTFTPPQCTNLNHSVKKSLRPKVQGGCVMLFRDKDCTGTYTVVVTNEDNKAKAELEVGMVKSMKPCPDDDLDDSWRGNNGVKKQDKKKGDDGDLDD